MLLELVIRTEEDTRVIRAISNCPTIFNRAKVFDLYGKSYIIIFNNVATCDNTPGLLISSNVEDIKELTETSLCINIPSESGMIDLPDKESLDILFAVKEKEHNGNISIVDELSKLSGKLVELTNKYRYGGGKVYKSGTILLNEVEYCELHSTLARLIEIAVGEHQHFLDGFFVDGDEITDTYLTILYNQYELASTLEMPTIENDMDHETMGHNVKLYHHHISKVVSDNKDITWLCNQAGNLYRKLEANGCVDNFRVCVSLANCMQTPEYIKQREDSCCGETDMMVTNQATGNVFWIGFNYGH